MSCSNDITGHFSLVNNGDNNNMAVSTDLIWALKDSLIIEIVIQVTECVSFDPSHKTMAGADNKVNLMDENNSFFIMNFSDKNLDGHT